MKRLSRLTTMIFAILMMVPSTSFSMGAEELGQVKKAEELQQVKRQAKKYDYFLTLGLMAWIGTEYQGLQAASKMVADFTVTDLARESLLKYTGIKAFRMGAASSLLAVTGRNIVDWAIGGVKETARDGALLKDDPQYQSNWLRSFFMYVFIPQLIKHEIINRSFSKISDSVGVGYPEWVCNNTLFLVIAWHISGALSNACGSILESVYDFFVPQTRAQQYLRYKRMQAYRAAAVH